MKIEKTPINLYEQRRYLEGKKRIEEIDKKMEKDIEIGKERAQAKYERSQEINENKLNALNTVYEEHLSDLKGTLLQQKERLKKEEELFAQQHRESLESQQENHTRRIRDLDASFAQKDALLTNTNSDQTAKLIEEDRQKLHDLTQKYLRARSDRAQENKLSLGEQKNLQENIKLQNDLNFRKEYRQQESLHKQQLQALQRKHAKAFEDMDNLNKKKLDEQKKVFQEQLRESFKAFQSKHANVTAQQQNNLNLLNKASQDFIDFAKAKNAKIETIYANRLKDDFYNFKTIDPSLKDKGPHYELSLKVPPMEKDKVSLSGEKRSLHLTYSRSFKDQIVDDQTTDFYSKAESYYKDIPVAEIIDIKKIEKNYIDGILTFTIPKA